MMKPDRLVVFFDPGLNGKPSLSSVDLLTVAGGVVNASYFQAEVILDGPKETDVLTWEGRPTVLMLCLISTLLIWLKIGPTKCKKATSVRSSLGVSTVCMRWIESTTDLLITGAVLFKCTMEEFQFSWQTLLVPDGLEYLLAGWQCDSAFRYMLV
jgi:hypothetical protein